MDFLRFEVYTVSGQKAKLNEIIKNGLIILAAEYPTKRTRIKTIPQNSTEIQTFFYIENHELTNFWTLLEDPSVDLIRKNLEAISNCIVSAFFSVSSKASLKMTGK